MNEFYGMKNDVLKIMIEYGNLSSTARERLSKYIDYQNLDDATYFIMNSIFDGILEQMLLNKDAMRQIMRLLDRE